MEGEDAMGRPPAAITLTPTSEAELEAFAQSGSLPSGLVQRARIVLACAQGQANQSIAAQMGIPMRYERGCLAGTSYCVVIPNGDVHPCPYLPLRVGNVRERPFSEIWADNEVFRHLRSDALGGKCGACRYRRICVGCRARAYYYSGGDYLAEEPWCLYPG
jgi:radical SAM protein with 4Fe4S-binding SPASM domain